jgi:hypothetical protein
MKLYIAIFQFILRVFAIENRVGIITIHQINFDVPKRQICHLLY